MKNFCGPEAREQKAINSRWPTNFFKMTSCCLEIIIAAVLNRLIGIIIVLGEHILTWATFKKVKKFSIVALIKTETEATDCSKMATDVAYLQIDLFGNDRGVTSGVRTRAQENEQKKANVEEFNRYFQTLWNIQRWLEASDSEVEILKETD